MDLKNKNAVITGGASGIGRATCEKLAQEGVEKIAVVDMCDDVFGFCKETNKTLERETLIPFKGDVADRDFRAEVFAKMAENYGPVNVCIPAAGIVRDALAVRIDKQTGKAMFYDQDLFHDVVRINLIAPIYWALESIASVAQYRLKQGLDRWDPDEGVQGAIIFIGSISSAGNRGQISYATTKAGLEGAQSTLAKEAIFHGVRCAIIHPGFTDTPMVQAMDQELVHDKILPLTQLRRLLRPEEIADAIVFMVRNSAVSGKLWADAGWHPTA